MPQVVIVTPALRDANNGNWQTARRWQRHLRDLPAVRIVKQWPDGEAPAKIASMIALHARAPPTDSIAAWARHPASATRPGRGADRHRPVPRHRRPMPRRPTRAATGAGAGGAAGGGAAGPAPELRCKCRRYLPVHRARARRCRNPPRPFACRHGRPLCAKKNPRRPCSPPRACWPAMPAYFIDHIGDSLDPALGRAAAATMHAVPNYRWLGGLPHEEPSPASSARTC
jgi:hypothetical protein